MYTLYRHYHKAVWSEKRYQQLLSTSAPPPASPPAPVRTSSHARRQLSATLEHAATLENTTTRHQSVTSMASTISDREEDATPTGGDPLQNSSDSVFTDNSTGDRLLGDRLLGNWEQPASPQIQTKGFGRPNPLTSHTSRIHTSTSMGEFPSHHRRVSLPSHTPFTSWSVGVGPLSPLAKGHKSRTPSGEY